MERTPLSDASVYPLVYIAWWLLSQHDSRSSESWGPRWLAAAVGQALRYAMGCLGTHSSVLLDGITEEELRELSPAVLPIVPHGPLALGILTLCMPRLRMERRFLPLRGLASSAPFLFRVPLLRELLLLLAVREADPRSLDRFLSTGHSLLLHPGGAWERASTSSEREVLYVDGKLSFVRLALKHGRPLLPMYAFGENQLYTAHSYWMRHRQWIASKLNVGIPLVTGRLGTPVPHAVPKYCLVLGTPIRLGPPNPEPTEAQVMEVYGRWAAEVRRLFDKHKGDLLPQPVAARGLAIQLCTSSKL